MRELNHRALLVASHKKNIRRFPVLTLQKENKSVSYVSEENGNLGKA